ncbi:MAG: hypothetical protein K6T59_06075 [Bryobacteraceae bacterium]|nr:hypothetical protein [Bryobacteraceae bacterium]
MSPSVQGILKRLATTPRDRCGQVGRAVRTCWEHWAVAAVLPHLAITSAVALAAGGAAVRSFRWE